MTSETSAEQNRVSAQDAINILPICRPYPHINLVRLTLLALLLGLLASSAYTHVMTPVGPPMADLQPATAPSNLAGQALMDQTPLFFVPNRGQLDSRVAFYASGRDLALYFAGPELTFALRRPQQTHESTSSSEDWRRWVVTQRFIGTRPDVGPVGGQLAPTTISYFKGPQAHWQTGLPTYASLSYAEVWPGIDMTYEGGVNTLKYTFVVKPGADPRMIRWAYIGASATGVSADGQLEIMTPAGTLADERPYVYQELDGRRVMVESRYISTGPDSYGFEIGAYDPARPLLIDPSVLVYGGYLGGSGYDAGASVALDSAGNAYVTGATFSPQLSLPAPGPDTSFNGGADAFVARISPAGQLLYLGYLGGAGFDQGLGIAIDARRSAYVVGQTQSDQTSFPVVTGPDLSFNGGVDAFVAKISADGSRLLYAGYLGGATFENVGGIAVDSAGAAYIAGQTDSDQTSFPVAVGPDLSYNGGTDAFVASVSADGSRLLYAGYLGGSGYDAAASIALGPGGSVYLTGATSSGAGSFPAVVGPDLSYNGGRDAFVAQLRSDGTGLLYAGYLGGSGYDAGASIAVDAEGSAYLTGQTQSSQSSFPVLSGPDTTFNGGIDGFVAKLQPDGTRLLYAGYLGGAGNDAGRSIAVGGGGIVYVTGVSASASGFPILAGPDLSANGGSEGFVTKISASGSQVIYSGYVGGSGDDESTGIVVNEAGEAFLTGFTSSTPASFPVVGGPGTSIGGDHDAFVLRLATVPDLVLTQSAADQLLLGAPLTYTLSISNPDTLRTPASSTVLTDTPAANVRLVSARSSQGRCSGTHTITCNLGTLANNTAVTVTIIVMPSGPGLITNSAHVSFGEPDPDPSNNSVTHQTQVLGRTYFPLLEK